MRKAKYLSQQGVGSICNVFGIETNKAAKKSGKKNTDANEWIPTEAVKVIKDLQSRHNG